jgi:hypothetical protein
MTVRKTESRLPRGFTAEDLGEVGKLIGASSDDASHEPDCYLISFLSSPLVWEISNTYVVFVIDTDLQTTVAKYKWSIVKVSAAGSESSAVSETSFGVKSLRPVVSL